MAAKQSRSSHEEANQLTLLALRAHDHLATASEARAQRPDSEGAPELKELRHAIARLEQFAEKATHDLRQSLFAVTTALELLSTSAPETLDPQAKKYLSYAVKGVQQMSAVLTELRLSARGGVQETATE
jgi:light-regulated signal transduction histidine kinase (bacteriophytochrome)